MAEAKANLPTEDAVVRVHSASKRSTELRINGVVVQVPHNQDFPLAGPFVELLENGNHNFTNVRPLNADEEPAGAEVRQATFEGDGINQPALDPTGNPLTRQKPGGDAMVHSPPRETLILRTGRAVDQKAGGDNLAHAGALAPGAATTGEERRLAEETGRGELRAAEAGLTEPVHIMRNVGDGETQDVDKVAEEAARARRLAGLDRDDDGAPGGAINVEKILEGTVPEVLKRAEKLDPDQRAALLAAEQKRENPRKGVVDGLAPE